MAVPRAAVRLLYPWNGRKVGAIIPQLDARIAADMVEHERAEYVMDHPDVEMSVVQDVTITESEPEPEVKPKRKRKKKSDVENISEPSADDTTAGKSC